MIASVRTLEMTYTVDLENCDSEEMVEAVKEAAYVYTLYGASDEMLDAFVDDRSLYQDQYAIRSEEEELLLFCYEELEDDQYDLLVACNIEYNVTDRDMAVAA